MDMDIAIIDSLTMIKDTVMTVVPQQMPQKPYSLMGILDISDSCRDKLVTNIGNEGVNLYVEAQYKNLIKKPYDDIKRTILSELFGYKGM